MNWREYQQQIASFFRELGCEVKVDAKIQGARSLHNIDVWVKFKRFGLEHKWVIECKLYNRRVPKEKVLILREIVDDIGAHRGILISEKGCQSGAHVAVQSTSIDILTHSELRSMAKADLLWAIFNRLEEKTLTLQHSISSELFFKSEKHVSGGVKSYSSQLRPGVDMEKVFTYGGKVSVLKMGMEQVRLGIFPALVGFSQPPEERKIFAHDLEDFTNQAGLIVEESEKWLQIQRLAIGKIKNNGANPSCKSG